MGNVGGLLFQKDNIPTNTSYAWSSLNERKMKTLKDVSVCLWLKLLYFREYTYLFSYAISDEQSNELNLVIRE